MPRVMRDTDLSFVKAVRASSSASHLARRVLRSGVRLVNETWQNLRFAATATRFAWTDPQDIFARPDEPILRWVATHQGNLHFSYFCSRRYRGIAPGARLGPT